MSVPESSAASLPERQPAPPIQDRRPKPAGVLPRQMQVWLMAGIALVILAIIFLTGRAAPASRGLVAERPTESPLAAAERIRTYRQQLAEEQARQQQAAANPSPSLPADAARPATADAAPRDAVAEERRRREYQSLFADNVALSRRPTERQPYGEHAPRTPAATSAVPSWPLPQPLGSVAALAPITGPTPPAALPVVAPASASQASAGGERELQREEHPAPGPRRRLLEGTVIEAVLTNRLDGALAGPVNGLVTNPVYALDRQAVLVPAGARVLGSAAPVQSWGESRLAISFHRLVMPDGHSYSLDRFKGLDQIGETGLRDQVNRHYLQVFGASLAIGAIAGLAQYNTRSGLDVSFGDAYRQAAGASLAASSAHILDRYLNVLPTITIREGFRLKVYLTNDLELPAYASVDPAGGAR